MKNLINCFFYGLFVLSISSCTVDEPLNPEDDLSISELSAVNKSLAQVVFISPSSQEVEVGETINFTYAATDNNPFSATFWATADNDIGSIDQSSGEFIATGIGEINVVVYYLDILQNISYTDVSTITVVDPTTPISSSSSISLNGTTGVLTGVSGTEVTILLSSQDISGTGSAYVRVTNNSSGSQIDGTAITWTNNDGGEEKEFAFRMPTTGAVNIIGGHDSTELDEVAIYINVDNFSTTIYMTDEDSSFPYDN